MAMIKMSPEEIRAKSQSYGQGSEQIHQILADLTRHKAKSQQTGKDKLSAVLKNNSNNLVLKLKNLLSY